jgi:hypothetical protein
MRIGTHPIVIFICVLAIACLGYRLLNTRDYFGMPDSRITKCAEGSVPARNGLDCKLPKDRYGL